ncbi:hypothetical protein ACHAXS_003218 [Conticribra weissflogii]
MSGRKTFFFQFIGNIVVQALVLFCVDYERRLGCDAKFLHSTERSLGSNSKVLKQSSLFYIDKIRGGYDEAIFSREKKNDITSNKKYYDGGQSKYNNSQVTDPGEKVTTSFEKPSLPSPYDYIPVTALDDYGQSTQLRHAMESAARYGTPILACIFCDEDGDNTTTNNSEAENKNKMENAIFVCSLQRPRLGVVSNRPPTMNTIMKMKQPSNKVHSSIQGMVKIIATRDDFYPNSSTESEDDIPSHTLHTAMVCTGIQSDTLFLQSQLQSHFTTSYWFRYNSLPSTIASNLYSTPTAVVKMVRDILLDCLGYDWSDEVGSGKISGGIGSAAPSYSENENDDSAVRPGRPLGVNTFLLGLDSRAVGYESMKAPPSLISIQANGASEQYVAQAMGVGAILGNELLSQRWKRCMNRTEVKSMARGIFEEISREVGWVDESRDGGQTNVGKGLTIVCETVTSHGVEIEFLPL